MFVPIALAWASIGAFSTLTASTLEAYARGEELSELNKAIGASRSAVSTALEKFVRLTEHNQRWRVTPDREDVKVVYEIF